MAVGFRRSGELRALARPRLRAAGDPLSPEDHRSRLSGWLSMPGGPGLVRPSALAPAWEAPLLRLVRAGAPAEDLHEATTGSPEGSRLAAVVELVRDALHSADDDRALRLTGWLVRIRYDPSADSFLRRYGIALTVRLPLSGGLDVEVPLDAPALRLLYAELAAPMDPAAAVVAVETLEPSTSRRRRSPPSTPPAAAGATWPSSRRPSRTWTPPPLRCSSAAASLFASSA
ncbi:hypothetical protein C5C74_09250 [Rathayibacter sp. AY1E8]|uniref:hypothetical protein n=1 Tax=Rathayibacter sp. AY1E8 TaxID=2080555 RepID=UPI000CE85913|nr:hypothetical protein [Rathayibacter sp. AY1E8]PPG18269.1 hypothetical protein C5C74_09250 [Rathayibacter sp. AY1E8]